uniref:Uncharacterized protein n=1 Tax=Panagrolaimus sp. ES5 TaxID=591445 RepID=A0AC34G9J0_9BILA
MPDVVKQEKPKPETMSAITKTESEMEEFKPKTSEESPQSLQDLSTKSKPAECYLKVNLKNNAVNLKREAKFNLKMKAAEKVFAKIKKQPQLKKSNSPKPINQILEIETNTKSEYSRLSFSNLKVQPNNHTVKSEKVANNDVKVKAAESKTQPSLKIQNPADPRHQFKAEINEPKLLDQHVKVETNPSNPTFVKQHSEVKIKNDKVHSEAANFTVKLKSTEVIEKTIKLQSSIVVIPQISSTASESYYHQPYISKPPKLKKLVSIEIQTDETSFDQRIIRNQQWNNDSSYDSDTHSSMISPKSPSLIIEYISDQKSPITTSSGFASTSDFSPYETASPTVEISASNTIVTFMFKNDETCAVEISHNGRREKLKNTFGIKLLVFILAIKFNIL